MSTRYRPERIQRLIKEAEKAGKTVNEITLPDGTKIKFGSGEAARSEPPANERDDPTALEAQRRMNELMPKAKQH